MPKIVFAGAVSTYGAMAKAKLTNVAAKGEPEDQLRAPLEGLLADLAELSGFSRGAVTAVGESPLAELKTRPDYSITCGGVLVGFVEVKAPGKGADPRKFKDRHDREQWDKLSSLPNLIYTDGNAFSLWRNGELAGSVVRLIGDIETAGAKLEAPAELLGLFETFLRWEPIVPRDAKQLAVMSARLCRLLRDEVTEQIALHSPALTALATDWRKLLFPDATDAHFADGYAQAVTFGLLMARAREIPLDVGLDQVARQLGQTHSLIGTALRVLTDNAENQATLTTSIETLRRVLNAVNWKAISKGDPDAWLYFYEDFLSTYDNKLRKLSGSYYTPPAVVSSMVRLVDEVLRTRFGAHTGLASPAVTLADPAVGTGTFLLSVLRKIAETITNDQGPGAVAAAIEAAMSRLIAFEIQLGPFAVAQLRVMAELADLLGEAPRAPLRMFVTDTLSNPYIELEWLPAILGPIAESRREANEIKKHERIMVVLGNPPYKEKAKGLGGWVESGSVTPPSRAPLEVWMPPREWGVGAHAKHLRNLYVYFWRWATWKVFDHDPKANTGIVCFITVAGFLNGPGFQKMRDYLRRTADEIWVIDCSPEGHQPEVNTRIFEAVQQPVCIVLASRSPTTDVSTPATVLFRSLPDGHREVKFEALASLTTTSEGWVPCPTDWRAPFLPSSTGAWASYPALEEIFLDDASGVMPGRTWVIAPDEESLRERWQKLIDAPADEKELYFHPHLRNGKPGDKHINRVVPKALPGFPARAKRMADERGELTPPTPYAFRSFDRQWIIPDNRLINQPNPTLWASHSPRQIYLTAPSDRSPTAGPALTFTALIPDLHHYNGRGGRVFPLWSGHEAKQPNVCPTLLTELGRRYTRPVSAEDVFAYIAAIAANPAYTARFQEELRQPGLRIPFPLDAETFVAALEAGRTVLWLHSFGERFSDRGAGRPSGPPRTPDDHPIRIPTGGAIPQHPDDMPDEMSYDPATARLIVGKGFIDGVTRAVWEYEVSGKQVLRQWFSYRKRNRDRPIIGDRRPPSPLGDIQPDHWLAEYTTELLHVLHVLARLVELEPTQEQLLSRVCSGTTISVDDLRQAGALRPLDARGKIRAEVAGQHRLLD